MQFRTVLFFLLAMALSVASAPAPSPEGDAKRDTRDLTIKPHDTTMEVGLEAPDGVGDYFGIGGVRKRDNGDLTLKPHDTTLELGSWSDIWASFFGGGARK